MFLDFLIPALNRPKSKKKSIITGFPNGVSGFYLARYFWFSLKRLGKFYFTVPLNQSAFFSRGRWTDSSKLERNWQRMDTSVSRNLWLMPPVADGRLTSRLKNWLHSQGQKSNHRHLMLITASRICYTYVVIKTIGRFFRCGLCKHLYNRPLLLHPSLT